jgi:hypothetical protein
MSDLSAKFTALEAALASQAETTDGLIDTVETKLQSIFDELDLMLINNAVNTRALLAALGAINPCAPCPTPSLVVPLPSTDPVANNPDKCKRTQAFLHAMLEVFTALDVMSAFAIPFNPSLISDAIGEVITALGNSDTTPLPSYPEAVRIVGDGINYVAGNFLVGDTLVNVFSALIFDLRDAIYSASDPSAARSAYDAIIDASDAPSYTKPLIKDAAYAALWSYYFDPASTPNLTGYDGAVCEDTGPCDDLHGALPTVTNVAGTFLVVQPADPYGPNPQTFTAGDFNGWTFTVTENTGSGDLHLSYYTAAGIFVGGSTVTMIGDFLHPTNPTAAVGFYKTFTTGCSFTIQACPP